MDTDSDDDSYYDDDSNATVNSNPCADGSLGLEFQGYVINDYILIVRLDFGSYSNVWLANKIGTDEFYAFKMVHAIHSIVGLDEAAVLDRIKDSELFPNFYYIEHFVCPDPDIGTGLYVCIIMNLMKGSMFELALQDQYKTNGFNEQTTSKIISDVVKQMKAIYDKFGFCHTDLKFQNIMIEGINQKTQMYIDEFRSSEFFQTISGLDERLIRDNKLDLSVKNDKELFNLIKRNIIRKNILELTSNLDDILENYTPDPIELNETMNYILVDYGLTVEERTLRHNSSLQTRDYRSPEVIIMAGCNYKMDIWSIGCIIYELLTAYSLFDGELTEDDDQYHMEMIVKYFGDLPKSLIKRNHHPDIDFSKKGKLLGMRDDFDVKSFDEDCIDCKINMKSKLVPLMKRCLSLQSANRPTFDEIIQIVDT